MHKEAVYIYGVAKGGNLPLTAKAVTYANELHKGQKRNEGNDYVEHPIKVCRYLLNHHILDDIILAAALLHDVIEDTVITREQLEEIFNKEVANLVGLLSKKEAVPVEVYYGELSGDIRAIVIKAADRACNIDDMINSYSIEKLKKYIEDTNNYVLPMMKRARRVNLEYSDLFVALRDHIKGVINAVQRVITVAEENEQLKKLLEELRK